MKITKELMLEIKNRLDEVVKNETQNRVDIQVTTLMSGDVLIFTPEEL